MPSAAALGLFAAVGLSLSLGYFMCAWACAGIALVVRFRRQARLGHRHGPGIFISREIDRVARRLRRQMTAMLVFLVTFALLVALGRRDVGIGSPAWVAPAIAALVSASAAFCIAKCVQLERYRRRLRGALAADIEIAQRLDEVRLRGLRVFHSVTVGDRVIDHVVVGPTGIFAAQVVRPPREGAQTVSLARGSLVFGPRHGELRLQPATEAWALLAKQVGQLVGHPVKVVRTVIAPGCRVGERDDPGYLLTNSQNCVMLVGWKDAEAYLMDDEVARISDWLAARCRPRARLGWYAPSLALERCVVRPALV